MFHKRIIAYKAPLVVARCALLHLVQSIAQAEAAGLLARREFLEPADELADDGLCRHEEKRMVEQPVKKGRPTPTLSLEAKQQWFPRFGQKIVPYLHWFGGPCAMQLRKSHLATCCVKHSGQHRLGGQTGTGMIFAGEVAAA